MEPEDRTHHIRESSVQTVSIAEIDHGHPGPLSAIIMSIVLLNPLDQSLPDGGIDFPSKSHVDQEVAELLGELKIRGRSLNGQLMDDRFSNRSYVPASEISGSFRFGVHRRSQGNDSLDLDSHGVLV